MTKRLFLFLTVLLMPLLFGWTTISDKWIIEKQDGYSLFYTTPDKKNIDDYKAYFENGKRTVEEFFRATFNTGFDIYIHPDRTSLDSAWQQDWGMPEFKSQCWMVASGVAHKLDLISPKMWDSLSCEHSYSDTLNTQRLITHEFVHVYHGQQNASPDFSNVSGMDWFVEGLAVYVSGQCDSTRITKVKEAISENNLPEALEDFWSGNLRYGLSGTVVMYLDKEFGREKLISLLKYNHIGELLVSLDTDGSEIIDGWKIYMESI